MEEGGRGCSFTVSVQFKALPPASLRDLQDCHLGCSLCFWASFRGLEAALSSVFKVVQREQDIPGNNSEHSRNGGERANIRGRHSSISL